MNHLSIIMSFGVFFLLSTLTSIAKEKPFIPSIWECVEHQATEVDINGKAVLYKPSKDKNDPPIKKFFSGVGESKITIKDNFNVELNFPLVAKPEDLTKKGIKPAWKSEKGLFIISYGERSINGGFELFTFSPQKMTLLEYYTNPKTNSFLVYRFYKCK